MERYSICRQCGADYARPETIRRYGADFPYGYCSPSCYTKSNIIDRRGK